MNIHVWFGNGNERVSHPRSEYRVAGNSSRFKLRRKRHNQNRDSIISRDLKSTYTIASPRYWRFATYFMA